MEDNSRFHKITSINASPQQLALVEEICNLKSVTFTSTSAALELINAEREIIRFLEISDPTQPFEMNQTEFVNFCNEVHSYAQFYLQLAAIEYSNPDNGGLFTLHKVMEVHERIKDLNFSGFKPDSEKGYYLWHFNYPAFFNVLFNNFAEYERVGDDRLLDPNTIADILENEQLLTSVETGKLISLSDFKAEPQYRSVKNKDLIYEKFKDLNDGAEVSPQEAEQIHKSFAEKSAGYLGVHTEHRLNASNLDVRRIEVECLYKYKEIYLKCKNEGRLDDPQTRRVIAIAFVMDRRHYNSSMFKDNLFPAEKLLQYADLIAKKKDAAFLAELTEDEIVRLNERNKMGEYLINALKAESVFLTEYLNSLPN